MLAISGSVEVLVVAVDTVVTGGTGGGGGPGGAGEAPNIFSGNVDLLFHLMGFLLTAQSYVFSQI